TRMWSPRFAAALIVGSACIAIFGFLFFRTEQPVSAEELLRRAALAESARMKEITGPVIYRRVQVHRKVADREDSATWESWKDVNRDRFRQRVAAGHGEHSTGSNKQSVSEIITDLEQIFRTNHLDAQWPLSVSNYVAWRKTVRKKSEWVTKVALPGSE